MKILCIDGGGIRGIYSVAILQKIEEDIGRPIATCFDLVAGTSTGSITAAAISLQYPMTSLLNAYIKFGEKIFKKQATFGLFRSVYSDKILRSFLQKTFKHITLSDIKKPLLIPAVDVTHGRPFVHRSSYCYDGNDSLNMKLWDAVLSSCSAPVFFPPNNISNKYLTIDGGLWANNPSLVCITEAVQYFHKELDEIKILSIGTGEQKIHFELTEHEKKDWGVSHWLPIQLTKLAYTPKLIDLALNLSSESISYHCELLLKENYLRVNDTLGKEVPFDSVADSLELQELGNKLYEEKKEEIYRFI